MSAQMSRVSLCSLHLTLLLHSRCICCSSKPPCDCPWSNLRCLMEKTGASPTTNTAEGHKHQVMTTPWVKSSAPPHSSLLLPSGDDYITSFECQNSVQIPAPKGKTQCGYSYRARFPAPNQSLYYSGQSRSCMNPLQPEFSSLCAGVKVDSGPMGGLPKCNKGYRPLENLSFFTLFFSRSGTATPRPAKRCQVHVICCDLPVFACVGGAELRLLLLETTGPVCLSSSRPPLHLCTLLAMLLFQSTARQV